MTTKRIPIMDNEEIVLATEQVPTLDPDLILANEQVEYYSERANLLETQLHECVELLKVWWGGSYGHPVLQKNHTATQDKLVYLAKANLL